MSEEGAVETVAKIQKMKVAMVLNAPDHITGGEGSDQTNVVSVIRWVETLVKYFVFRVCCHSQGNSLSVEACFIANRCQNHQHE